MKAHDLETLYAVERYVEPGIASILALATNVQALSTFSTGELKQPRLEISLEMGRQSPDHHAIRTVNGYPQPVPDAWDGCTLVIRSVVNRTKDWQQRQAKLRAQIRLCMLDASDKFTEAALPYHQIMLAREAGTSLSVDSSEDEDVCEIRFDCDICIRENAWP